MKTLLIISSLVLPFVQGVLAQAAQDVTTILEVLESGSANVSDVSVGYQCVLTEDIAAQKSERDKILAQLKKRGRERDEQLIKSVEGADQLPDPMVSRGEGRFGSFSGVRRRTDSLFGDDPRRKWVREYLADGRMITKQVTPRFSSSALITLPERRITPPHVTDIFRIPLGSLYSDPTSEQTWVKVLGSCRIDKVEKLEEETVYSVSSIPEKNPKLFIDGVEHKNFRLVFHVSEMFAHPLILGYEIFVSDAGGNLRKVSAMSVDYSSDGDRHLPQNVKLEEFWEEGDLAIRTLNLTFADWKLERDALKAMFDKKIIRKGDWVNDEILDKRYEVKE